MILELIWRWSNHQHYFQNRKDLLVELLLSELPYDRETIFWHSFNSARIMETATLTACNIFFMDLYGFRRWSLDPVPYRETNYEPPDNHDLARDVCFSV